MVSKKQVSIGNAIRYPFKRVWRLFYSLWAIIPILGWFAFSGYLLKVLRNVAVLGNEEEAPKFGSFWKNYMRGLIFFVIIFIFIMVMNVADFAILKTAGIYHTAGGDILIGVLNILLALIFSVMVVQYVERWKFNDAFNISRAVKILFRNFESYIIMMLKQIVVSIVFILASLPIITLIMTFPAMCYSKHLLFGNWYRNAKKPKE